MTILEAWRQVRDEIDDWSGLCMSIDNLDVTLGQRRAMVAAIAADPAAEGREPMDEYIWPVGEEGREARLVFVDSQIAFLEEARLRRMGAAARRARAVLKARRKK